MDPGGAGAAARLALAFESVAGRTSSPAAGQISSSGVSFRLRSGRGAVDPYSQLGRQELDSATGRRAFAHRLGAQLTADALKQHLPAGAKLWVNLPPLAGAGRQAGAGRPNSAVQIGARSRRRRLRSDRYAHRGWTCLCLVSQERACGRSARIRRHRSQSRLFGDFAVSGAQRLGDDGRLGASTRAARR
jgi:hypothetical protein